MVWTNSAQFRQCWPVWTVQGWQKSVRSGQNLPLGMVDLEPPLQDPSRSGQFLSLVADLILGVNQNFGNMKRINHEVRGRLCSRGKKTLPSKQNTQSKR